MIAVDGQKAYSGVYAERVQNRQTPLQMTKAEKEASVGRVKEAVYDSFNTEVLGEYKNPVEQMDKAVSAFHESSANGQYNDLFAKVISQNSDRVAYSKYMGSVTHTKEEEQQYGKELFGLFEQLKRNPSGQADIWSKIQNTMLNYPANGGGSKSIREQVLASAGDSFTRMELCWSLLLKNEPSVSPLSVNNAI